MSSLRKYEYIKHENYDLCHRNDKKKYPNFVLLKVASDKKFGQHFPYHKAGLHSLYNMVPVILLFVIKVVQPVIDYFTLVYGLHPDA
jgi:hypothetical protein